MQQSLMHCAPYGAGSQAAVNYQQLAQSIAVITVSRLVIPLANAQGISMSGFAASLGLTINNITLDSSLITLSANTFLSSETLAGQRPAQLHSASGRPALYLCTDLCLRHSRTP